MAQTILALGSLMPKEMEALESHFSVIRLWKEKDPEAALQKYKNEITGIVSTWETPVSERLIAALPNLEIIGQCAVGIDNIDLKAAKARGIIVTNTPGVLTDDTADIALALILATARRIVEADMYVRVGKWLNGDMPLGVSVSGKIAGIIGMGRIGRAIAKRCEAFNMKIIYNGPHKKDVSYEYYKDLNVMAAASDFL
ncbi:MAG TPA: NAD(P)-dependent oxidoreductase, partial [Patescibacteria group bacterium]|nr:NAD(P)-dependent oxidoreductase [Patescibacteria group bacterium]